MNSHQLITIKFSHYNEKARWALDRFGLSYQERSYLPVFHFPFVLKATRLLGHADNSSTKASTPVLKTPHGLLCDSSEILAYVSGRFGTAETTLYPCTEVHELDRHFSDRLGPHTRRVAYHYALQDHALMTRLINLNAGGWQVKLWPLFFPIIKLMLKRTLAINPQRVERSIEWIKKEFATVSVRLKDGRRYLVGGHFTAADLCFACMAAPVLLIEQSEGYFARLPYCSEVHSEFSRLARELRETPAGEFALRVFREERNIVVASVFGSRASPVLAACP